MYTPSFQEVVLLLTGLINAGIGIYVFSKGSQSSINRSFFAFVSGIALWIFGFILLRTTGEFIFDKLIHYGGLIIVAGLFRFAQVFPSAQTEQQPKKIQWFQFLPLLAAGLFIIPFNLLIERMERLPNGSLEPINGPLLPFYIALLAVYMLSSVILLWRSYKKSDGIGKLKLRYFFLGTTIFTVCALIFDGVLPSLGYSRFNLLGPLSSIAIALTTAYAIVRHQLLDIRVVIQRSAIYLTLFATVAAIYLGILFTLAYALHREVSWIGAISAGVATLLGIFGVPPLERYFRKITDPIFFKNRYNYAAALHDVSETLNRNLDLQELKSQLAEKLKSIFKVEFAWVLSEGNTTPVTAAIAVPVRLDENEVGSIALSKRLSDEPFTTEDMRLLKTIANQAAVAITKAELYTQVKEYSHTLEERVQERTRELEKLQQEERQTFLNISHSLQTPLTVLKIQLEKLRKEAPDSKPIAAFEQNIDRVAQFIYDLLKLARLEALQPPKKIPINFSQSLDSMLEYVGIICKERNISIDAAIEADIVVAGDRERLEEMVINLLSNAIKYMKPVGEKRIAVTLKSSTDNAVLTIFDTGIGISAKELPNIFKRFFRSTDTEQITAEGTGLGLAIAKKIIELHQGTIMVESTPNQGTTFTVTLPRV